MTPAEFQDSVSAAHPPAGLAAPLEGLWWAAKGAWDRAHRVVQDDESADAAWVHAYLHRVEGDLPNAGYWYRTAGRPEADGGFDREWSSIVAELLRPGRAR
jgi:hypothetical protein